MKPLSLTLAIVSCGVTLLTHTPLSAAEQEQAMPESATDTDLPQGLDPKIVGNLLENSPFTRTLDPAETFELTGVAYISGKPVVTLRNKFTKQQFLVSDTPSAQKWVLLEVSPSDDLSRTNVRLVIEDEIVSFHFSESQLAPEEQRKAGKQAPVVARPAPAVASTQPQTPTRSVHLSDEIRQQYTALPDAAKQRYKEILEQSKDKATNATPEQRAAFKTNVIEKLTKQTQTGTFK